MTHLQPANDTQNAINSLLTAIADDLRFINWLHATPHTVQEWGEVFHQGFPKGLALYAMDEKALTSLIPALPPLSKNGLTLIQDTLMPYTQDAKTLSPEAQVLRNDDLAAEHTAIYITHHYHASPNESVWTDEDHLGWQNAMFDVRKIYQQYGLQAKNWRVTAEDHLCSQLEFVVYLIHATLTKKAPEQNLLAVAARFMNEHINNWMPQFAAAIAARTRIALYADLAVLSAEYLKSIEDCLTAISNAASS